MLEIARLRKELAITNSELQFENDRGTDVQLIDKLSKFSHEAEHDISSLNSQTTKMEAEVAEMTEYLSATDLSSQEIFRVLLQFIDALKQSKEVYLRQRRRRHK